MPSSDIPDERETRLVILGPEFPHTNRDENSAARQQVAAIVESRGSSPRNYKNTLVFVASDAARLRELEQAVRQFLAWSSILRDAAGDPPLLTLDNFQQRQAQTKRDSADEAVDLRIGETYQWLLVPGQPDPKGPVVWTDLKLSGSDAIAIRAAKKLKNDESLMVQMGGIRLRTELDRVPLWNGNHVSIKQLVEYMARYLYLPRLRDENVLLTAIQDGVSSLTPAETFAYAEGWDEHRQRYQGLKAGVSIRVVVDDRTLLVKPEAAAAHLTKDRDAATDRPVTETRPITTTDKLGTSAGTGPSPVIRKGGGQTPLPPGPKPTRFHGSVRLDPLRLGRDASRIAEEVIQHLTGLVGAEVEISLDIQARLADGATDKLVRDVTENCRTLKFTDFGFEEE